MKDGFTDENSEHAYARFHYKAPEWQDLLQSIDFEAISAMSDSFERPKGPINCVLDTNFFFSGFRSYLRWGGLPKSLEAARDGLIRLYLAADTLEEVFEKSEQFTEDLKAPVGAFEEMIYAWAPYISVAELEESTIDPRVEIVALRDPDDRPAAQLAALIAPCVLLTEDKDFEGLGICRPCEPVVAVKAAIVAKHSETQLQAMVVIPVMPVLGAVEGVKWAGSKLKIHPMILVVGLVALGIYLYKDQPVERRAAIRSGVSEFGKHYAVSFSNQQFQNSVATKAISERSVAPSLSRNESTIVMAELAQRTEPTSAQGLWEEMDPATRPSVTTIREILRSNPSAELRGRGIWTFGIQLDEFLEMCNEES